MDPADGATKTHLANRERDLRVFVGDDGVWSVEKRTNPATFRGELALVGFAPDGPPLLGDDTLSLSGGAVTQMWTNTARGVEHVFIVDEAPGDELVLTLDVVGVTARSRGAYGVHFVDGSGAVVASYTKLAAFDADAEPLPAWMDVSQDGRTISLRIDVDGADWPVTVDPITSGEVTRQGPEANSSFGVSVAVGDINQDEYDDLVVGAPGFDSTASQDDEGAAFWYLGSASGIPSTATGSREGCSSSCSAQFLGSAVALGDVNGDGKDDLLVTLPGASSAGNTVDGTIKVYLNNGSGSFASSASTLNTDIDGCQPGDRGGLVVADVDDDGGDDVIARCAGVGVKAHVLLWWGVQTTGPAGAADLSEDVFADLGAGEGGHGLVIGDVTGDGVADLAVPGLAVVRIFPGGEIALDPDVDDDADISVGYETEGELVATLVDVNGGGFADLIIGDEDDGTTNGYVAVFLNAEDGSINDTPATEITGAAESGTGSSIAGADVNADGHGDVVICARLVDDSAVEWVGRCDLYSGSPSGLETSPLRLDDEYGTIAFEQLGAFHGGIAFGDFTGDGAGDAVLGSPLWGIFSADARGQIRVYDGERANIKSSSAAQIQSNHEEAQMSGPNAATLSGGPRVISGDVDSDSYDDLIVGVPWWDAGSVDDGAVFVWRGGSGASFNSTVDWTVVGESGDQLGTAVAFGRFHGAGQAPSIAASEPKFNSNEGRVLIFKAGSSSLPTADDVDEANQVIAGDDVFDADEAWGNSMVACGNLFNDLGDCLAVGAPAKDGETSTGGSVYVYKSTGSSGLSTDVAAYVSGDDNGTATDCTATFGQFLANVGNANDADAASPTDDLVVGAPACDRGSSDEGAVFLYDGEESGVLAFSGFSYEPNQANALMGPVAAAGDISGDGISDFVIAAPLYDSSGTDKGRVYFVFGSNGTPSAPTLAYTGTIAGAQAGRSLGGGYDVNRDGFMDVIVGEPALDNGHTDEGRAIVFHGGLGGPNLGIDRAFEGQGTSLLMGASVTMGDFNGDGYGDIAIGAPGYGSTESEEGRISVVFGEW